MVVIFVASLLLLTVDMAQGVYVGGYQFSMADCPNRCLTYDSVHDLIELADCRTGGNKKAWELNYSCGQHRELKGFFQIRNVVNNKCVADPKDCSICNKDVSLVDCESDRAAWFSHGHLHKTAPKAYNLYSVRCWLNEGKVSVLTTPSMEAKTCPEDHSVGACQRLEWNADHYSRDIAYYEWSFNEIKTECEYGIFTGTLIGTENEDGTAGYIPGGPPTHNQGQITVDGIDIDGNEEKVTSSAANNDDSYTETRNIITGASCAAGALLAAGIWRRKKKKRKVQARSRGHNTIQEGAMEDFIDIDINSQAGFEVEIHEYEDEILST